MEAAHNSNGCDVGGGMLIVDEAAHVQAPGPHVGQCKWFSDKLGYGFITIQGGAHGGKDVFVHHSGIRPLNSNYKTLRKGEYVNLSVVRGDGGMHAVNVTGIGGGTLMCDVTPVPRAALPLPLVAHHHHHRHYHHAPPPPPPPPHHGHGHGVCTWHHHP